jgi:hypothetical protein
VRAWARASVQLLDVPTCVRVCVFLCAGLLYSQYKTVQSVDVDELTKEDMQLFVEHDVINPHPLERKQVFFLPPRAAPAVATGACYGVIA